MWGRSQVLIDLNYFDWKEPRSVTEARDPSEKWCEDCGGNLPWHLSTCKIRTVTKTLVKTRTKVITSRIPDRKLGRALFQVCDHLLCTQPATNRLGVVHQGEWKGRTVKTCPDHADYFRELPEFKGTPGLAVGALI